MHTEALHKQNLNTEELLQTEAGTQRNFRKQKLLHTERVLHRRFYTQELLHQKPLHREVLAHRSFYLQKLLCKEAFVQKSLPIFYHVSFFMIICHLSPSYISSFSCSFGQLPLSFNFHFVLSVHASCSLPLRRSKLNENAEIDSD